MAFAPKEKFGIKLPNAEVWESAWEFLRILSHGYRNSKKAKFDDTILTKKLIADSYNKCIWDIYSILQWGHDKTVDKPSQKIQFSCPEHELLAKNVRGIMGLNCSLEDNEKIPFTEIQEQFLKLKEHFEFSKNFYISCPETRNECDDEYVRKAYFEHCGSFIGDDNGLTEAEEKKIRDEIRKLEQEIIDNKAKIDADFIEDRDSEETRYESLKEETETRIQETLDELEKLGNIEDPNLLSGLNEILQLIVDERTFFQDAMEQERIYLYEKFTENKGITISETNDQRDNVIATLNTTKANNIERINDIIDKLQEIIDDAPSGSDVSDLVTLINEYQNIIANYDAYYSTEIHQTEIEYSELRTTRVEKIDLDYNQDTEKFEERAQKELDIRDEKIEKIQEIIDYFNSMTFQFEEDYLEAIEKLKNFKTDIGNSNFNYSSIISDLRNGLIQDQNELLNRVIDKLNSDKIREKDEISAKINGEIDVLLDEIEAMEEKINLLIPDPLNLSTFKDINIDINNDFDSLNIEINDLKNSLTPGNVTNSLQSFIDTNNDRKNQLISENIILENMANGNLYDSEFFEMISVNNNIIDILVEEISDVQNMIMNLGNGEDPAPYNDIIDALKGIIDKIKNKIEAFTNQDFSLKSEPYEEIIALDMEKNAFLRILLGQKLNFIDNDYSVRRENEIRELRTHFAQQISEFDERYAEQYSGSTISLEIVDKAIEYFRALSRIDSLNLILVGLRAKREEIETDHTNHMDEIRDAAEMKYFKMSSQIGDLIEELKAELDQKLKVELIIKKMFEKMNAECKYSNEGDELPEYTDDDCSDKINPTEEEVAAQFDRECDNGVCYDQTPPIEWKKKLTEPEVKITEDDILFDDDVDAYKNECEIQTPNGGKINVECGHTFLIYHLLDKDAYIEHH